MQNIIIELFFLKTLQPPEKENLKTHQQRCRARTLELTHPNKTKPHKALEVMNKITHHLTF